MSAIKKHIEQTTQFDDSLSSNKYLVVKCDASIDADIIDLLTEFQFNRLKYLLQAHAFEIQLKIDSLLRRWGKIKVEGVGKE